MRFVVFLAHDLGPAHPFICSRINEGFFKKAFFALRHLARINRLAGFDLARKEAISRRHDEQREERGKREATRNGDAHRDAARGAGHDERHRAQHRRKARHEDWAEAAFRRHPSRFKLAAPGIRRNLVRKFHNQDTVLRHERDKQDKRNLAKDIERLARNEQASERTRERKRHRKEDDERSAETFELARKHQEHERKRQEEHNVETAGAFFEFLRRTAQSRTHVRVILQQVLCNAAHFFNAVANRLAGHKARLNRCSAKAVESVLAITNVPCILPLSPSIKHLHSVSGSNI